MVIRVRTGKGGRERLTILSPQVDGGGRLGRFRPGLLTRLFATLSANREQGPHFSASLKTYPIPADTADSPRHSNQRRKPLAKIAGKTRLSESSSEPLSRVNPIVGFPDRKTTSLKKH